MWLADCVSQGVLVSVVFTVVPPHGMFHNCENQSEGQESSNQRQDDQLLCLLAKFLGSCHVIFLLSNVKLLLGFHGIYHSWNSTGKEQNYGNNGENGEESQIFFSEFTYGTGGVIWWRNDDATSVFSRHHALFLWKQNLELIIQINHYVKTKTTDTDTDTSRHLLLKRDKFLEKKRNWLFLTN